MRRPTTRTISYFRVDDILTDLNVTKTPQILVLNKVDAVIAKFGAPPHGGIALGIDRWVMLFAGLDNIREVIAFPKTQRAFDNMTEAPGSVDEKQLKELALRTVAVKS